MTPSEKAYDLVLKFQFKKEGIRKELAKRCALIAFNEIIDAIDWHEFEVPNKELNFWFEVKKEIEKL
jgi:hypothetical protein